MTSLDAPTRPVRVAVVADDDRVRTSLRHMLASSGAAVVVGSSDAGPVVTGAEADVVVLDLAPASADSHRERLASLPDGLPAVVLGDDRATARVARAAGASYLDKADVADQLLPCVLEASRRSTGTTHTGDTGPGGSGPGDIGGIVLVTLALFAGPWTWWFSRIAEDHGLIGWHLPQGLALWTMPPLLAAALGATGGRRALADLARRITRIRVPARTWAAALLAPVLVAGLAAAVTTALGRQVPVGELISLPAALVYLGYGTGLFLLTEEAGWRGALLPRLQQRLHPWQAALLLGIVWAGWHLPLLAVPDAGDHGLPVLPFLVLVVATSVLISGLVNAASGSVVVAAVFHASFDASYSYLGVVGSEHAMIWAATGITVVAAAVLVARTRGRLFLPPA